MLAPRMFDIRWIRESPEAFNAGLRKRGLEPRAAAILDLDERHRVCQTDLQAHQARRNDASKAIGAAKAKGDDASGPIAEVGVLKEHIRVVEEQGRELAKELDDILKTLPNLPADDVPEGPDEAANVEVARWGEAPRFDFAPQEHFEIGEAFGLMDFETAAKLSGSRFVVLKGALARLERALAAFMLDLHTTEFGYTEVSPPLLVRDHTAYGTGNLPKFEDDLFSTKKLLESKLRDWFRGEFEDSLVPGKFKQRRYELEPKDWIQFATLEEASASATRVLTTIVSAPESYDEKLYLIPTAEMPLTNLVRESILAAEQLPLRFTAHTPCFRREAGAAGKDTRGMIRQHQFSKVELVSIAHPDSSDDELERMRGAAEEVLRRLGLHYRVVVLSSGDMGFAARKTYDIEVWLPGQDAFREISSCSNCGDFQARRMNARFREAGAKGTRFVHSLNGSGLAVGRTMVAILENYQRQDGSVVVPEALRPYVGGLDVLTSAA